VKDSEKINIAAGIVLFAAAAFFSIALLVRALDFGMYSSAHNTVFFSTGFILYDFYGLSSVFIPSFILVAGVLCFLRNWSKKRGAHLAGSVVPFFTIVVTEKLCRQFMQTDDGSLLAVKITIVFFICALVVAIEYLVMGIAAEIGVKKLSLGAVNSASGPLDGIGINSFTSEQNATPRQKTTAQHADAPSAFTLTNTDALVLPPEDEFFPSREDCKTATAVHVDVLEESGQTADAPKVDEAIAKNDVITADEAALSQAGFFSVAEADFLNQPFGEEPDEDDSFLETAETFLREEGVAVDSRDKDEAVPLFASALENKRWFKEPQTVSPQSETKKLSEIADEDNTSAVIAPVETAP
jgi:hypothetical protein